MRALGGYQLGELLARGGAGSVHRAVAPDGSAVALKLIADGRPLEGDLRRRFEREAEALLRLEAHPNLVRAREVVWDQGRAGLVLELLQGEDLETRLVRGPLPVAEAARIGVEVARGLAHAHARGVVHRDVKPANVLVDPHGRAVLVDFGLARNLASERSHLTRTGTLHGTPGYWPPEQATGELARIGPASDVYGLGATLYALLSGRPPILADTIATALTAVLNDVPPPLSGLRREVDAGLAAIVHRCLAKRPEERWPTADALAAALEAWLATHRLPAAPRGDARPFVLAAAILCAGGLGAAALFLVRGSCEPAPSVPPAEPTGLPGPPAPDRASSPAVQAELAQVEADMRAGRAAQAEERLLRLFEQEPGDSRVTVLLALLYHQAGRPAGDVIRLLDRGVALRPDLTRIRARRGVFLYNQGRYAEALADVEAALAGEPLEHGDQVGALHVRGGCKARQGDTKGAARDLDAALALEPGNAAVRFERGAICGLFSDHQGVVDHITIALALGMAPGSVPRGRAIRGGALLSLERPEEARVDLEAAIPGLASDDSLRAPSQELLRRLVAEPRPVPAEGDALDQAINRTPGDPLVWTRRAADRSAAGRHPAAADDLWRALSLRPEDGLSWLHLARVEQARGRTALARSAINRAVAFLPSGGPEQATAQRLQSELR